MDPSRRLPEASAARQALVRVKALHTLAWAFFAACIVAIPACAVQGKLRLAAGLIGVVAVEVVVLVANHMRCPLTDLAARYTDDRRDNFDIYLPLWLARHNQRIFGALYLAGIAVTLGAWAANRTA